MKDRNKPAYLHGSDSVYYGAGLSSLSGSVLSSLYLEGNIDEFEVTPMSSLCTVSNEEIVSNSVSGYLDLYSLDKLKFTTTYSPIDGDPTDVNQTYSYFAVPYEVTAEKSQHLDSGTIAIINAIPIIIIVAMITMAVGFFLVKRE